VKQAALIHVPDGLSTVRAASVPVAGGTARQGLTDLNLAAGETLFIAGASGAIGSFAIQLAAQQGVRVAGSASAENQQYMLSLGAEKTVDYSAPDWQTEVWDWAGEGVDAALAIQPNTGNDSIKVTRDGGRVITISGYGDTFAVERGVSAAQMTNMCDNRPMIEQLLGAITKGSIQTTIEAEYPFSQALTALEKAETRHARGKLVVSMLH
jgi:NADPH:quinone reductase-like Zn-dependent oxidoreductase